MDTTHIDIADIYKCNHCGKIIEIPEHAVDFHFYAHEEVLDEKSKAVCQLSLDTSPPFNKLKFTTNFIAPCLCSKCDNELKEYLTDFVQVKERK